MRQKTTTTMKTTAATIKLAVAVAGRAALILLPFNKFRSYLIDSSLKDYCGGGGGVQ